MQTFSIRNIEILTGIKAHTLRIWEQRYDFYKAPRKDSKQRFYSNEDLKQLLCVSFLYNNGWKPSKIATLSNEEIAEEVRKVELGPVNFRSFIHRLLQAAINFNEAEFLEILTQLIETLGFEQTIVEICYPYLKKSWFIMGYE